MDGGGNPPETGGSDLSGGGNIPVGGPTNTDDAALNYQVGTDIWSCGIDASDTATQRPYKIVRGGDLSTPTPATATLEVQDDGQLTAPFYTTIGDVLTVLDANGNIGLSTPAGGTNVVGKTAVNAADNIIPRTDTIGGRLIKEGYASGAPSFSDTGQITMPFYATPGDVLTVGAAGLITGAAPTGGTTFDTRELGTGVFSGLQMSINVSTSSVDIAAGVGQIVDTATGVITTINFAGALNVVRGVASTKTHYYINAAGNPAVNTQYTPALSRSQIYLGYIAHPQGIATSITELVNVPNALHHPQNQLKDLSDAIGSLNLSGNLLSAPSATLGFAKSSGTMYSNGANFNVSITNPHLVTLPALDTNGAATFDYYGYDGTTQLLAQSLHTPNILDTGGAFGTYGGTQWGAHRVYVTPNNDLLVAPAQFAGTNSNVIDDIQSGSFIIPPRIVDRGGMLIGYIVNRGNVTSLQANTEFLAAGKFGGSTGSVPGGTETLQTVYDNGEEILTSVANTAVKMRRGTAADTDNVLEIRDNADNVTIAMTGDGQIQADSIDNGPGRIAINDADLTGVVRMNNLTGTVDVDYLTVNTATGTISTSTPAVGGGTLQAAYNGGEEILTSLANTAVKMRRGTAADTDNVLEIRNNADNVTSFVRGNGGIGCSSCISVLQGLTTAPANAQTIGFMEAAGFDGVQLQSSGGYAVTATENWTTTNRGCELVFSTTETGTNTLSGKLAIDGAGHTRITNGYLLSLGNAAADPTATRQGQIYWNSVSNTLRVWNGAAWQDVGDAALPSVTVTGGTSPTQVGIRSAAFSAVYANFPVGTPTYVWSSATDPGVFITGQGTANVEVEWTSVSATHTMNCAVTIGVTNANGDSPDTIVNAATTVDGALDSGLTSVDNVGYLTSEIGTAHSVRKLRAAYTGFCCQILKGVTTTDIGFDNDGYVSRTQVEAAPGGGSDYAVTIWYDQSGNGRNATSAVGQEPRLIFVGVNNVPEITFGTNSNTVNRKFTAGANDLNLGVSSNALNGYSIHVIAKSDDTNAAGQQGICGDNDAGILFEVHTKNNATGVRHDTGAVFTDHNSVSLDDLTLFSLVLGWDDLAPAGNPGTDGSMCVKNDGTLYSGVATRTTNDAPVPYIGSYRNNNDASCWHGSMSEFIIFKTGWVGAADVTALDARRTSHFLTRAGFPDI